MHEIVIASLCLPAHPDKRHHQEEEGPCRHEVTVSFGNGKFDHGLLGCGEIYRLVRGIQRRSFKRRSIEKHVMEIAWGIPNVRRAMLSRHAVCCPVQLDGGKLYPMPGAFPPLETPPDLYHHRLRRLESQVEWHRARIHEWETRDRRPA